MGRLIRGAPPLASAGFVLRGCKRRGAADQPAEGRRSHPRYRRDIHDPFDHWHRFAHNPDRETSVPGRSPASAPTLSLSYDSGAGNGPFGLGWSLSLPSITRRTDKGLPRYRDEEGSDCFLLSGVDDLVPVLVADGQGGSWKRQDPPPRDGYRITSYRPRIETLFARIERWTRQSDGDTYWRSISRDNITNVYGGSAESPDR